MCLVTVKRSLHYNLELLNRVILLFNIQLHALSSLVLHFLVLKMICFHFVFGSLQSYYFSLQKLLLCITKLLLYLAKLYHVYISFWLMKISQVNSKMYHYTI